MKHSDRAYLTRIEGVFERIRVSLGGLIVGIDYRWEHRERFGGVILEIVFISPAYNHLQTESTWRHSIPRWELCGIMRAFSDVDQFVDYLVHLTSVVDLVFDAARKMSQIIQRVDGVPSFASVIAPKTSCPGDHTWASISTYGTMVNGPEDLVPR